MASRLARAALFTLALGGFVTAAFSRVGSAAPQTTTPPQATGTRAVLDQYCVTCHNQRLKTAGLLLDTVDASSPQANPEIWEKVITRLNAGSMPPAGRP